MGTGSEPDMGCMLTVSMGSVATVGMDTESTMGVRGQGVDHGHGGWAWAVSRP